MRQLKKISPFVITSLIFTSLVGCSITIKPTKSDIKEIKIGVTLYKEDDAFISTLTKNIEEIAKDKEKELGDNSKITLNIVDSKGSLINQSNQIEKFISQEYDVICINIVDRTAASTLIDKAKLANIPVIFFNREPVEEDMERWNKLYYVGAQAEQSGEMQASIIIDEFKKNPNRVDKNNDGKIQYVMLEGEQGHQDTSLRTEYCIKTISEKGIELEKLADDTANWESSQGNAKMTQWIKNFGDKIEVVFSNNDAMALGAIQALNSSNITNKPLVVGIDGVPEALTAVKNGEMAGTVINDSFAQASGIFNIAYDLATLGNVYAIKELERNKYFETAYTKFTIDNIDQLK